jgi:hypothetical protein
MSPEIHMHKGTPYIKIRLVGGVYGEEGVPLGCYPATWSFVVGPDRESEVEFLRTAEVDSESRVVFREAPADPVAREAMAKEAYRLSGRA